ncbi:lipopolysaccharide biosynthesis protein [Tenacibaculum sp. KUL118]|nr:lipopolysaccharide biosynthesis protein [Tenacibaculum sp. KUL118]
MSLGLKTLKSSFLILFVRGVQRSIGLVSMLVLARLLTPEDFGVVAIASVVVFFFDVLTESGSRQYLIQKDEVSEDDIHTAWSLNVIIKLGVFIVFIGLAPLISSFFEREDLNNVFRVIAIILPLGALASPGIIILQRNLDYAPITKMLIYEKVLGVIITISFAYFFQNYWAMILGMLFSYSFKTVFSYVVAPFSIRLSLSNVSEQWHFSKWILLKGALGYSKSEVDPFVISKIFNIEAVGGFNMMKNISTIPAREIIRPLTEPLLASFSVVKTDSDKLSQQVAVSMLVLLFGTSPIAMYLFSNHEVVVTLLFDERWLQYSYILGVLSLLILNFSIVAIFNEVLVALGKVKVLFFYDLITFAVLLCVILSLEFSTLAQFAEVRVFVSYITMLALFLLMLRFLKIDIIGLSMALGAVFVSCYLASTACALVISLEINNAFFNFIASGAVFSLTYVSMLGISLYILRKNVYFNILLNFMFSIISAQKKYN